MVNIHHINELTHSKSGISPDKPSQTHGNDAFESALSSAMDKTESSDMQNMSSTGLEEIMSVQPVSISTPSDRVSSDTEKLLSMLDTYAGQLQDPAISLKQMAPVLETINEQADQLMKGTESLDTEDAPLRTIATQAALAARTEYIKFQRGDYLS